jgi:amidohydrolase
LTSELTDTASSRAVAKWVDAHADELIALRRDIHAHPEIGHDEHRTTALISDRLTVAGLRPRRLPSGTGLICDIGATGPTVVLRADIDALEVIDAKDVAYRSQNLGLCHACGHDVHTAALVGAAGALARLEGLPGRVRLIFQPAEEQLPGGALELVEIGALRDVDAAFALHCDPRLTVGTIGLRVGPITAACDTVEVHLSGPGGHTARPQLTADLVYAIGKIVTEVPAMLSRRVDPRSGLALVWAQVSAGAAVNAIPQEGWLRGTVRVLDPLVWEQAEALIRELIDAAVAPTGAHAEVSYGRGVPPVINDAASVEVQRTAIVAALGIAGVATTEQSMGGEDFAWMLREVPGSLARLGVRPADQVGPPLDLHRGTFDVDEGAIAIGANFMAQTALAALGVGRTGPGSVR